VNARPSARLIVVCAILMILVARLIAQDAHFHNAPAETAPQKNPYAGQSEAVAAGSKLFAANCASCHGPNGQGTGNVPALTEGATRNAPDGEVFWFITTGSIKNGMPPWNALPEQQRWQIVSYLKSLRSASAGGSASAAPEKNIAVTTNAPPPAAPFTDFRFEAPGKVRWITPEDLPAPYATETANNGPQVVARPDDAWPQVPAGFKVELYASRLENPRLIRTAPNGDFFLAESSSGKIKVLASPPTASRSR